MEHLDDIVIDIDIRQVVQLLKDIVARIVEHAAARMVAGLGTEPFPCHTVVQVLTGVNLIADIHTHLIIGVEYGFPAFRELLEAGVDESLPDAAAMGTWYAREERPRRWRAHRGRGCGLPWRRV